MLIVNVWLRCNVESIKNCARSVSSSPIKGKIAISRTYADAPIGGIHNSKFLSSKDSHNLMYLGETNEKLAPFRSYHGFVRKDNSIRPVIQFPAFLFPFDTTAFAFSRILYPLSHRFFTVILLFTQMTRGLLSSASYRYGEVRWVLYYGQDTGRVTAAL